jgi:hypothetical protein
MPTMSHQLPEEVKLWRLRSGDSPVSLGERYSLQNIHDGAGFLGYGERAFGINLVWENQPPDNITFRRQGRSAGPLVFGESISMHVKNHAYVRYGKRTWGVNLVWTEVPVYDWQIHGGEIGSPVPTGANLALFNETEEDFLVYYERPFGINLGWSKSGPWLVENVLPRVRKRVEDYLEEWLLS